MSYFLMEICLSIFLYTISRVLISSHVVTELSIVLVKYSTFSQLHVVGFQIKSFSHALWFLDVCTLIDFYHYSTFYSSYIFYHQIYIYIHMIYILLVFLIHLFPAIMIKFKPSVLFGTLYRTDH